MKKLIYNKFKKETLASLKKVEFYGRIYVVDTRRDAERAVDFLLSQPILGLDTETRPAFTKGKTYHCALLQVSTLTECFLFRLNRIGLCPAIIRLLSDSSVKKVGLAWHNDLLSLHHLGEFEAGKFVDLQDMVRQVGIEDQSLVKIYANLFNERISKTERLSNWERTTLKESQMVYAAIDAWACVRIYNELERLIATGDYELITMVSDEESNDHETNLS